MDGSRFLLIGTLDEARARLEALYASGALDEPAPMDFIDFGADAPAEVGEPVYLQCIYVPGACLHLSVPAGTASTHAICAYDSNGRPMLERVTFYDDEGQIIEERR